MRLLRTVLSIFLIALALVILCFAGSFLWQAIPRADKDQPDVLNTDQIFQPEEPSLIPQTPEQPVEEAPVPEAPPEEESPAEAPAAATPMEDYLAAMTLEEKIWQLFITTPEAITGADVVTRAGDATGEALAQYPVGGLCYFAANLESSSQVQEMLAATQAYAKTPLFLCIDEEGGAVSRAGANENISVTHFESAQALGRRADVAEVYGVGKTLARELTALGFNVNFAPVADVITNENNTEIGDRSYSSDPAVAGALVCAMTEGLQRNGMIACLKHFPGHGSTETDSHEDSSVSTRTLEELRQTEWVPFRMGIEEGAAFVMLSHQTNTNLSDRPASLSPEVVNHLRSELGFTGIIITDSQQMGAIANHYTSGEAAILAIQAGVDMILMPADLQEAFAAIRTAVEAGTIPEARINESVLRILEVKYQYGIIA